MGGPEIDGTGGRSGINGIISIGVTGPGIEGIDHEIDDHADGVTQV
jgi:hypothetical protein